PADAEQQHRQQKHGTHRRTALTVEQAPGGLGVDGTGDGQQVLRGSVAPGQRDPGLGAVEFLTTWTHGTCREPWTSSLSLTREFPCWALADRPSWSRRAASINWSRRC